jgi:hypothetical protein
MVNIIGLLQELHQKQNKYAEFVERELNAIKAATAERIKRAASNGEIPEPPEALPALLYAWHQWGNPEEATAYVQSMTETDERLAKFLNRFIYQTYRAGGGDRVMTTHNKLAMKHLSDYLDLAALRQRLSNIDVQQMDDRDKVVIKFVLEQLEKMQELALTPEQFDHGLLLD